MESAGSGNHAVRQSKAAKTYGMARHTTGIILLMCVVFLWTASNFLASVCALSPAIPVYQKSLANQNYPSRIYSQMTVIRTRFSSPTSTRRAL
jgi:hypothetical protein